MIVSLGLRRVAMCATLSLAAVSGGCSGDGMTNFFSTGSLGDSSAVAAAKAPVDPACVTLAAQIDKLHQDGAVDRLEKAADGKTQDVKVKRASLVEQTQLNKANADFIAKCGPSLPRSASAVTTPSAVAAPVAKVTTKVSQAGQTAKDAGVTVAPPTAAAQ